MIDDPSAPLPPPRDSALGEDCVQLRAMLELRNCALDAATTHFLITDCMQPDHPIVFANRAVAADHGYTPDELIGRGVSMLMPEGLDEGRLQTIRDAVAAGKSLRVELRSRRKDGSTFWAGIALHPVRNADGCVTHYVTIGADITARLAEAAEKKALQERLVKEMEERERMAIELRFANKLEALGQLAAGVAHEINTPIQYIGDSLTFIQSGLADLDALVQGYRSAIESIESGASTAAAARVGLRSAEGRADWDFHRVELPKAIERALEGVERVAHIVRAMKEFAHPDSGTQSPADLNHALQTTLTVARSEYKHIATVETDFGDLPQVLCNVGELSQVFLNIVVNAAHAIESAGRRPESGRIRIATRGEGNQAIVEIEDNGCGIPQENLDRIFDPFFTTKAIGKGTGQGLAIARTIVVDKHAGRIEVNSTPGEGTRFRIVLPVEGCRGNAA